MCSVAATIPLCVLLMHPYVAHSICFSLRYDPAGKDIVSMVTALLLAHPPPPHTHTPQEEVEYVQFLLTCGEIVV